MIDRLEALRQLDALYTEMLVRLKESPTIRQAELETSITHAGEHWLDAYYPGWREEEDQAARDEKCRLVPVRFILCSRDPRQTPQLNPGVEFTNAVEHTFKMEKDWRCLSKIEANSPSGFRQTFRLHAQKEDSPGKPFPLEEDDDRAALRLIVKRWRRQVRNDIRREERGTAATEPVADTPTVVIEANSRTESARPSVAAKPDMIVYHGNSVFSVGGERHELKGDETNALLALLENGPLEGERLKTKSGYKTAQRAMRRLCDHYGSVFAPYITLAGTRGRRYHAKIRDNR